VRLKKFKVTEKNGIVRKGPQRVEYSIPFLLLIVLSIIGIVRCISQMLSSGNLGPIIVLFWLCFNLFLLTMAVFFVLGRDFQRKSERAIIAEPCQIKVGSRRISAMTKDISETGLSVLVEQPVNIDEEDEVQIEITTGRYRAILFCTIIHSDILPGSVWKYAFHIHDYGDTYPDFLQIIYDRTPTLPQKLEGSSGAYYDLRVNVSKRVIRQFYQRRKRTRVPLDTMVYDTKGLAHRVLDINFRFLIVEEDGGEGSVTLVIQSEPSLFLDCERVRSISADRCLLEIKNYDDIAGDVQKITALEQWVFAQYKASMEGAALDLQEEEAEAEEPKEEAKAYFSESDYL
jgi:cellulose synthase (UDP-forming)